LGLTGSVFNDTKGVTIEVQGEDGKITQFISRLRSAPDKPPLAAIESCTVVDINLIEGEKKFAITASDSRGGRLSQVTADITICSDCLGELGDKKDFRYCYPFINCTNCGPRYSIVRNIPYDRPNTTMSAFKMCKRCASQYGDVTDRRFHAQPIACPVCGPHIWLADSTGKTICSESDIVISETAGLLREGKIVAIKGIGGFHLAADALNNDAVLQFRQRKRRDHKPFALMVKSVDEIRRHTIVNESAEQLLKSPQCPIVLLSKRPDAAIAPAVAPGVNTFGFMLCYAPVHHLLFAEGIEVLVMTSGNISDEPLICKNELAVEKLCGIADVFLMHDREIYRQVDDSIVHFIDDQPVLLRRARGYVPTPILIRRASSVVCDASEDEKRNTQYAIRNTHHDANCTEDIFAAGADLKNTFCFVKQNQLICSEHIGDLEDAEVYHHYINSIEHLRGLFEVEPQVVVCDLHPGYLSTRYALSLSGLRVIQVQHHWAHVASVLAEHGLEGPVIGLVCDGTGYGTDGAIWGCECLIASLTDFKRFGHLAYYPLPGADKASKEAIRSALSLLKQAYGREFDLQKFTWLFERIVSDANAETQYAIRNTQYILGQLEKRINCVDTSSLGRVFDAVAAMLGLVSYNHFDAQLPMALEAVASYGIEDRYEINVFSPSGEPYQFDLRKALRQLVNDVQNGVNVGVISAKFHNTLSFALLAMAKQARKSTKLNTVALSGGVFCNRYLANRLIKLLKDNSFSVLFNRDVPPNDGGISLGQAAIAAEIVSRVS
jgi:hydrogenase maturation protein HypF